MNGTMTDKKPTKGKGKGRPPGRKITRAIQLRAPEEVADALARLAERHRRTQNQELLVALENHLRAYDELPQEEKGAK